MFMAIVGVRFDNENCSALRHLLFHLATFELQASKAGLVSSNLCQVHTFYL
jgi:hypothetical protein